MADSTVVQLSLGLLTIIGSGLTSSWVTHRLNKEQSQTIFLRQKAETLYLAAEEYNMAVSSIALTYFPLFDGRYDYNAMLDQQVKSGAANPENGGAKAMTMIVEIYFPTVRPALERVWRARDAFNDVTSMIRSAWIADEQRGVSKLKASFMKATLEFDKAISEVKLEIVEAARLQSGVKQ